MLRILGKASSINVRKVLWTCAELGLSFVREVGIFDAQIEKTGAYAAGADFSLADIVLGLSLNRWLMTPMARPDYPALHAYAALLQLRPACREFCMNGTP